MSTAVRARSTLATLVALSLSCGESAGPEDAPGTYALRRVARDPLPAILYDNEIYAVRVISDTIRLRADGTGTISGVREAVPLHEGLPHKGPMNEWIVIRYRAVGDELEIEYDCPVQSNCAPPPQLIARRSSGGLTARWGPGIFGRSPLLYTEVEAAP
jgi:hypothetical protein